MAHVSFCRDVYRLKVKSWPDSPSLPAGSWGVVHLILDVQAHLQGFTKLLLGVDTPYHRCIFEDVTQLNP